MPFVQRTYETVGRDDVYRVPVKEVDEGQYLMSTRCAGEYALMWFSPSLLGEEDEAVNVHTPHFDFNDKFIEMVVNIDMELIRSA